MRLKASIIDYPREDLDPEIWDVEKDPIALQPEIKSEVDDIVDNFLSIMNLPREALLGVYLYGSMLTNQWNSKTDLDGRILLDKEVMQEYYPDMTGDDLFDLVVEDVHGILLGDTKHPLNFSIIIEGEMPDLGQKEKDPVYDLLEDAVVQGPIMEESFDPDEVFKDVRDETTEVMTKLDTLIQDARTDAIDYESIEEAIQNVQDPDKLIKKLEDKLEELNVDVGALTDEYADLKKERDKAYEQGENHKDPGNVQYKMIEKYHYLDILKKLKLLYEDGIDEDEVEEVVEVVGDTECD